MAILNDLDIKLLEHFRGYVVKKDLVRSVKVGANVPVFVLEYLIANSCSTDDDEQIQKGMDNVKKILSEHYVNPEESTLIHSKIREKGRYKIIDKISVELDSKKDIYWASLQNSNIKNGNINDSLVKEHEKILMGGIWAIIDVEYDADIKIGQTIYPFVITDIKPIQLSSFDNSKIVNKRKEFTKNEWLDIIDITLNRNQLTSFVFSAYKMFKLRATLIIFTLSKYINIVTIVVLNFFSLVIKASFTSPDILL